LLHQQQNFDQSLSPKLLGKEPDIQYQENSQSEKTREFFNTRVKSAILSTVLVIIKDKNGQP
jgi:hypothetical protein